MSDTINLSTTINVSNISADEIRTGLAKINGTDLARFGNINRPNEPAITQTSEGVVTINSYDNYIYFNRYHTNGAVDTTYFTGKHLGMFRLIIGQLWGYDAAFSHINHFNTSNFAFAQNADGQTYINSATNSILMLKGLDVSGNINASSLNTSTLTIPNNTITKDKITNLNTSLDSLSNCVAPGDTCVKLCAVGDTGLKTGWVSCVLR